MCYWWIVDDKFMLQFSEMQMELGRLNAENQRLKEMFSQVNHNYQALQMHLVAFMHQQPQQHQVPLLESARVPQDEDYVRWTTLKFLKLHGYVLLSFVDID